MESTIDLFAEFLRLRYPSLSSEFLEFKTNHAANSPAASVAPAAPVSPILASKTPVPTVAASVPVLRSSVTNVAAASSSASTRSSVAYVAPAAPTCKSPTPSSSDSESDMEVDPCSAAPTDGFTVVQKGKKRAAEARAPAAAKVSKAANASRPRPPTPVAPAVRATPSPRPVAQSKTQTPPPEERELRVVIRGIPKELDADLVKADLIEQGLPVNSVHRMHTGRGREPYNMVLVALQPTPEDYKLTNGYF
ncbi:angiomotin-like [Bombyx mandarina]|uniref:Angiomotin-like n=1 Tax=Bombyx mandarina TaxID=7092 RepID=A0A6J2JIX7_BOMMA|nr:angiomotin-like [Bombyx mandarina]